MNITRLSFCCTMPTYHKVGQRLRTYDTMMSLKEKFDQIRRSYTLKEQKVLGIVYVENNIIKRIMPIEEAGRILKLVQL
jgi:hypothetical protein